MKGPTTIGVLVVLAGTAFCEQNALAQSQSAYNLQQNDMRNQQGVDNSFRQGDRQTYVNSLANLTKLRSKLAEAWQRLGMSPQAAQAVASAYQPSLAQNVHHDSLHGKSSQEVATMLQAALAKKDYMLANQTLIDYERDQAHVGSNTSPTGRH
ncbi:hypothetical protein [Rhodanobacter ginsengiterrae]|uniref:hypothetical protein n=1 Tax=Rhodanobacter ginsengiterrae TaxID=2008451 RepID=UPI003CE8B734